jgi:hypothetical protein
MKMPRRKKNPGQDEDSPPRLYGCLKCGEPCYFELRKIGENYEPVKFTHYDRGRSFDHPATPTPKIEGINIVAGRDRHEVTMRECGYCGHPIWRISALDSWEHAQWGKNILNFDHPAKIERPSHEECRAYRDKFQMMVHADGMESKALGLTPIGHFIRAAKEGRGV